MNERQFNAIRSAEASAAIIAERNGMRKPTFFLPNPDPEIEFTNAAIAIADFMAVAADAPDSVAVKPTSLTDAIAAATVEELVAIPGVGQVTAEKMKGLR